MNKVYNKRLARIIKEYNISEDCIFWQQVKKIVEDNMITPTYQDFKKQFYSWIQHQDVVSVCTEKEVLKAFQKYPQDVIAVNKAINLTYFQGKRLIDVFGTMLFARVNARLNYLIYAYYPDGDLAYYRKETNCIELTKSYFEKLGNEDFEELKEFVLNLLEKEKNDKT